MVRIGAIAFAVVVMASCATPSTPEEDKDQTEVTTFQSLWTLDEVKQALENAEDILLVDMRKGKAFEEGHVPGAHRLWRDDIQSNEYPYSGMRAERDHMQHLLDSIGATKETTIITYDDRGGCDAARLWWLLRFYGHPKVALMDGGFQKWKQDREKVSQEYTEPQKQGFTFAEEVDSSMIVTMDAMDRALSNDQLVIIDTRSLDEYTGAYQKKGAAKAGRIPGSILYDWGNAVDMNGDYCLKPIDVLTADLAKLGIDPNQEIIAYCHTGVRSAHTTFVLSELLGCNSVANYDGSWTEWSHFDALPFETDSISKTE